jgi:competence protein ComEC
MVEHEPGSGGRARARALAAAVDAARRRAGLALPEGAVAAADRLGRGVADWIAAELVPGRLAPWLPVGFGIVLYFTASREPDWWAALGAAAFGIALTVWAHRSVIGLPLALGFAAIACGFAVTTLQTARLKHPVLIYPTWRAQVTGFVEAREERARSDRIVVRVSTIVAPRMRVKPKRVRVAVRTGTAPAVGSFVGFKAHLAPPLQPLRPGGYDFARGMYFQKIGASGFVLGRIKTLPPPHVEGLALRYAVWLDGLREAINQRIHVILPGDRGSIASALITGKRNGISEPVREAFYVSSLAHVLAISGFHMAVVAGIVFFVIRALLALSPSLASRRPIKKWAAIGSLIAGTFYLLLSGTGVSTQRAFIMVATVLIGVMLDRTVLTFRTLSVAAFAVLLFAPQAVTQPSFQMSFAATLALIAAYQYGWPWRPDADTSAAARAALWGWREIAGVALASLVAGLATTPYAAYHFHRLAPYGVLANVTAMPLVSAWVMPMGILAVVALPFGFDAPFWWLMGHGIDWIVWVAQWVAHLPGAIGHIHAFGSGPLLLASLGLLLVCLLRTPLRGADGRLAVLHSDRDTFALKDWLAADADPRAIKDKTLQGGVRCDAIGCIGRLKNGRLIAYDMSPAAFAEDCTHARVVISRRSAPGTCAAKLIDRNVWRVRGAVALRWEVNQFVETDARPIGTDRPWSHLPPGVAAKHRALSPDATPKPEDLEEGD